MPEEEKEPTPEDLEKERLITERKAKHNQQADIIA